MHKKNLLFQQLKKQGIFHPALFSALKKIPREHFIPSQYKECAYENKALPIDCQQTISQPYIVALMTQELLLQCPHTKKILEVGTGSGYQTAVLCSLFEQVYSIERIESLHLKAKSTLSKFSFHNLHLQRGDGTKGWKTMSPFDGMLVTAATPVIPIPLLEQLSPYGGVLIVPIGAQNEIQNLTCIVRKKNHYQNKVLASVSFVPLITDEP